MKETQASINEWGTEVFGQPASLFRIATRANLEMAELLHAVSEGDAKKIKEETADIAICLCRLSHKVNFDMMDFLLRIKNERAAIDNHDVILGMNVTMYNIVACSRKADMNLHYYRGRLIARIKSIAIALHRTNLFYCSFLSEEIDKKMAINRSREWDVDHTGCGRHK